MRISQKGIDLIKGFEGCRLTAYKPVASEKYWTIGWGHYGPDVTQGMTITQECADALLVNDLMTYEADVRRICNYLNLNQNQFDALVSFTYNCGSGNLIKLTKNQTRTTEEIAEHIEAYNKGANGVLPGLVRRRRAERALFEEQEANKEKLDFLGITRWHKLGFKGKGITLASREGLSEHGLKVNRVLQEICPEATIRLSENYSNIPDDIDIYTTSYFQKSDSFDKNKEKARALYDKGTFLICAIGNDGEDSQTYLSQDEWWTSVGACNLVNGKIINMYYSSKGETLDFMSFTNMKYDSTTFTGTSCATPVFAGMCALVQQFFKEKIGRKLANFELYNFVKENTMDLSEEGFDEDTGWGLFILPDPEEIDVSSYEEELEMRYQTINEIPTWGKATIEKLVEIGFLKGNGNGLDLSEDMLRMLVILDRAGIFE